MPSTRPHPGGRSASPPPLLLLADTDHTQAYVFESTRLPEIRGASRILDDANRQAGDLVKRAGGEVIVQAGGMLIALVPDEPTAQRLQQEIEQRYAELSHGVATVTVAWRALPPDWEQYPFGDILAWAGRWLERIKRGKTHAPWTAAPPYAERCRSCGLRPASPEVSYTDWPLCLPCRHKTAYQGRWGWFEAFERWLSTADAKHHRERWEALRSRPPSAPRPVPQDIHELAQASARRKGTFALVYLDGDGVGQAFRHCQSSQEVQRLSRTLEQSLRAAVFRSLAQHLRPERIHPGESRARLDGLGQEEKQKDVVLIYPFEILTIGGDDVWLLVPTHAALNVALTIMEAFQERGDNLPINLSLSGGVVFAEEHVPVQGLLAMAKALASSAKAARRKARLQEGYLDFWVVTSDLPDRDIHHLRRLFPYRLTGDPAAPDDAVVRLSARPYSLSQWQAGLRRLARLSLSPSQAQQLATVLPQGIEPLRAYYHYQRARSPDIWEQLSAVLQAFADVSGGTSPFTYPWFAYQKENAAQPWTPLVDVLELLPFVASPPSGRVRE